MSKRSEAAKARRHWLRDNDPDRYKEYLRQQRDNVKRARAKKTPEQQREMWQKYRVPTSQAGLYRLDGRRAWNQILNGMKARAAKKGIPYDDTLTVDYMISITPTHCPVLGIELKRTWRDGNRQCSPSVDRLDPQQGYTRDNIIVVSYLANTIRTNATSDQILAVGHFYKTLLTERGIVEI